MADRRRSRRLRSFSGTPVIGGFLAGLESLILHRPPPAEVAELHATTSSFAPRSRRKRLTCSTLSLSSSGCLIP